MTHQHAFAARSRINFRHYLSPLIAALAFFHSGVHAQISPTYTVLYNFAGTRPFEPTSAMTPAGNGSYYGTSSGVNVDDGGTVYKLAPDGSLTVLYAFTDGADGANPGTVIVDEQGNLYGTTSLGGSFDGCYSGCGVLFKLAPDGTETVLHEFNRKTDGAPSPQPLVRDSNGNLYGATTYLDKADCNQGDGCGEIFKWAPDGTFTILHAFSKNSLQDGIGPNGGLIADHAGNLYGTTRGGGYQAGGGNGVVFKLAPDGTYTVLHRFAGGLEGERPMAGLIGDKDGNLYGTTAYGGGGTSCTYPTSLFTGCGTVYKLAPNRTLTTLYAFKDFEDGYQPQTSLYRSPKTGALFGTTTFGGPVDCSHLISDGCGVVFMISANGNKQTLHAFGGPDGSNSTSALIKGNGAQLIGTAFNGGANGWGVIYSLQLTQ